MKTHNQFAAHYFSLAIEISLFFSLTESLLSICIILYYIHPLLCIMNIHVGAFPGRKVIYKKKYGQKKNIYIPQKYIFKTFLMVKKIQEYSENILRI